MAKINPNFAYDVYRFLIKPMRDVDDSGVLERYLGGVQTVFEDTVGDIDGLSDLFNLETCPDWALDYLLHHLGWTVEVNHVLADLTPDQKRKVLRLSAGLWKLKGTERGIKEMIRVFTGRDVLFWSWHYLRMELDVSGFWFQGIGGIDPWLVGSDYGDSDEYLSIVWVADEDSPPRQLIHDLLGIQRPTNESFYVCYADLVDDFHLGLRKWTLFDGSTNPTWDEANFRMIIPDHVTVEAVVAGIEEWVEAVYSFSYRISDDELDFSVYVMSGEDPTVSCYRVDIDYSVPSVTLFRIVDSVDVSMDTVTIPYLPVDSAAYVSIRVTRPTAAQQRVQVSVDGLDAIDVTSGEPNIVPPGAFRIRNGSSNDMYVDNVIAYDIPLYRDIVGYELDTIAATPSPVSVSATVIMDGGTDWGDWTLTGLWHTTDYRYMSPLNSIYFGTGESGWWDGGGTPGGFAGAIRTGRADSPSLDLTGYTAEKYSIILRWYQLTRIASSAVQDLATVKILVNGVVVKTYLKAEVATVFTGDSWQLKRLDITEWVEDQEDVQIRFDFDSVVNHGATDEGWYVDHVTIQAEEA